MAWQNPKTDWAPPDTVTDDDMKRIERNIKHIEVDNRTLNQATVPTGNEGALQTILNWFANRIGAITGKTNWFEAPDITLAATKTHVDAASPHSGHALTSRSITGTGSLGGGGTLAADRQITHLDTAGNRHIPSGGVLGQILGYGGASGVGAWIPKPGSVNVQIFTASGTWTKPAEATWVLAEVISGGGGGGGGRRRNDSTTSNTHGSGGGGGGGGGFVWRLFRASALPASVPVVVGAGGGGGIGGTTNVDTNGGSQGGTSSFNSIVSIGGWGGIAAESPASGSGGGISSVPPQGSGSNTIGIGFFGGHRASSWGFAEYGGGSGGDNINVPISSSRDGASSLYGGAGGGGGGYSTTDATASPGNPGGISGVWGTSGGGAAGGTTTGAHGTAGANGNFVISGSGGGGGARDTTGNGGNGGNGGIPGGGGGGGGSTNTGAAGGRGGNGGRGEVRIIWW